MAKDSDRRSRRHHAEDSLSFEIDEREVLAIEKWFPYLVGKVLSHSGQENHDDVVPGN